MKTFPFIFILAFLISCKEKEPNLQEEILKDIINETYETITADFKNLQEKNVVIVNSFDDHLDSLMILRAKKDSAWISDPQFKNLISKLEKILNEPILINLEQLTVGRKFELIDSKIKLESFDYNRRDYIGSSTISQIALDQNHENGVFYVDVQFRKPIGAGGFFVFIKKDNNKWIIDHVWPIWTGQ